MGPTDRTIRAQGERAIAGKFRMELAMGSWRSRCADGQFCLVFPRQDKALMSDGFQEYKYFADERSTS